MNRRLVLQTAGASLGAVAVPPMPHHRRLGSSDVYQMESALATLTSKDQLRGGAQLAPVCSRLGDRARKAIRNYTATEETRRRLTSLAGEANALAAWSEVDSDRPHKALGHLDTAWGAANDAGDLYLQAEVMNLVVLTYLQAGEVNAAFVTAESAQRCQAARRDPKVAALFQARTAYGHALRGERDDAQRLIGRAEDTMAKVDPREPVPLWLQFFDDAELASLAAATFSALNLFAPAADYAQQAVDAVRYGYARNEVVYTLELAGALAGLDRPDQAALHATAALRLTEFSLQDGLRQGRVARKLREMRKRSAGWPDDPHVHAWYQDYAVVMARA